MQPQNGAKDTAPIDGHSSGTPEPVRVSLLGGFAVSIGARTIRAQEWRRKKAGDLVKLLALTPGHRMHRERAMDLLWPGLGPKAAANNFRQALHMARRVLDPVASDAASSRYLRLEGELLVLCPDGQLRVDVETFETTAGAARRSHDAAAYRAALNLYAGDLLPEDRYEDWAEDRREGLRRDRLTLLVEMAELCEERGDLGSAIDALREAISDEPAHEEAHAGLMRLYARTGQRYQALRQYEQIRQALHRRFGTEPGATTRHLREEIVAGRAPIARSSSSDDVSPQETLTSRMHNVPAALSSFIGRERERVEIERALAMSRLLTLTGVGGCGKTRLALEVTKDVVGIYRDGAWLVELAPLSNPELLPETVAAVLSVRQQSGALPIATLQETLRDKELLLVLDNCEHLLNACARLAETLLGSCPGLRILATSREALGAMGEWHWVVPPLSVPDSGRPTTVEETAASESVLLFLDRARYRRPAFALTQNNLPAVVEICRRLDGIPLAIELAAAWVGTMSLQQIAARLKNSLGLLTRGGRTTTPRQRTLRAALEWSHELLNEPERRLFARLSVFAGGWTLDAVEAVAPGDGVEEDEVLDLLSSLVDKSLVETEAVGDGDVRYGMLEPVRQYAQERLVTSGEPNELRRRHAAYFLAAAEAAEPELFGPRQGWWLDRLEREHDNLRAALGWSIECGDELGLRLGGVLSRFWFIRGYLSEGRRWLEGGLVGSGSVPAPVRAKALAEAGWLAEAQGDFERARVTHEESLSIYRRLRDMKGVAGALANLGRVAVSRSDHERATELLEESLAVLQESRNERELARVLTSLGILALAQGEHARTATLFEEALSLRRNAGDVRGEAVSLNNLGFVTLFRGDSERAMVLFEEALARNREVGDKQGIVVSLTNQGLAALTQGNHGRAAELLEDSLTLLQELENKQLVAEWLEAMAGVAGARREAQLAARLWGAAQTLRENIGAPLPTDELAIIEPHLATARSLLGEAWEVARTEGQAMTAEEAVEFAMSREKPEPPATSVLTQPPGSTQPDVLTRREEEVAVLVARGLTNRQIATELTISEHTAATHIRRILKKLGLHSRSQLTAWVTERRLSPL
jgi:predicted ATPase/DNA-binding SARP family transcriptional activator/DNA-binding CsgD family transcriptional regulator